MNKVTAEDFRPSSAHRWIKCPGSVRLEKGIPDIANPAAKEGTEFHNIIKLLSEELIDQGALHRYDYVNYLQCKQYRYAVLLSMKDIFNTHSDTMRHLVNCNQEMLKLVQEVFYKVLALSNSILNDILFEKKCDIYLNQLRLNGTADCVVLEKEDENSKKSVTKHIIDFKYGIANKIYAFENPQLILYALGAYKTDKHGFIHNGNDITVHIFQPRLSHYDSWEISQKNLLKYRKQYSKYVEAALAPDAPLNPSEEACRWCKAKAICPALQNLTLGLINN